MNFAYDMGDVPGKEKNMKIIKAGIVIRLAEYPGSSYHQIRQAYQGKATILCYT